nr:translation initiation factor IF-2-like [Gorilla gorilla gorilla]
MGTETPGLRTLPDLALAVRLCPCAPHLWRPCSAQSRGLLVPSPSRSPPLPVGSAPPTASASLRQPRWLPLSSTPDSEPPLPRRGLGAPALRSPTSCCSSGPLGRSLPSSLAHPTVGRGSPARRPRPRRPEAPARVAEPPLPPGRLCSAVLPGLTLSPGPCCGHPGTFRPERGSCCRGSWDRGMGTPTQRPTGSWPPRAPATRTSRSIRSEGPVTATEPARGQSPRQQIGRRLAPREAEAGGSLEPRSSRPALAT